MWKGSLVTGLWHERPRRNPMRLRMRYRVESAVDLLLKGLSWKD